MEIFGRRSRFAIEVGENQNNETSLRYVDVWAARRWLTCDDNLTYVPQFCGSISSDLSFLLSRLDNIEDFKRPFPELTIVENFLKLRSEDEDYDELGSLYEKFKFMYWGPTVDNVSMLLFIEDGVCYIPFTFWRDDHHDQAELGKVFVAEIPVGELFQLLHKAVFELAYNWCRPL